MHIIIIYLIKAAIFQALLLACYWLLLRRDTFYKMNRFYFIGGLLLSLIVPLINFDISSWFRHKEVVQPVFVYQYIPDLSFQTLQPWWQQFSFGDYTLMLFATGSLVMLVRLLLQYLSLKKLETKQKARFEEYNIQLLDDAVNPFSFGKTIYLNPQLHSEYELDEIIEHELVHIVQKHSIDIIAASINRSIFWWNPAAWVLNKVMRDNLEYIADKTILEKGFDRKHYQYHLLRISQLAYPNTIAQHFNFSNLKKRIAMMNKKETSRYQKMKWLLLVPIAAILLLSFNYRENIQHQIKIIAGVGTTDTIPELPRTPYPVKLNSKGNYVDVRNYNGECIVVVESKQQKPIARIPLTKWNAEQKKYNDLYGEIAPLPKPAAPAATRAPKAPRAPAAPAAPALPKDVTAINIRHDNDFSVNQNSHKNTATVTLKNGKQENYNLDNPSERKAYEKKYGAVPAPPPPPPAEAVISEVNVPSGMHIYINGVERTQAELNQIPASSIKSVDVYKTESTAKESGEKGKDGVIKITTKPEATLDIRGVTTETNVSGEAPFAAKEIDVRGYKTKPIQGDILFIIDGYEKSSETFAKMPPEEIESVTVLKGDNASAFYGEKAKNGVIVVKTKNAETKPANKPGPVKP